MADFSMTIILGEHGSMEASVQADGQHLRMLISYLSDALGDLTEAVMVLLRSLELEKRICSWQDEPGEYRWIIHRAGKNVRVQILRFDQNFSRLPDERGECVFDTNCTLMRLATQTKGQLQTNSGKKVTSPAGAIRFRWQPFANLRHRFNKISIPQGTCNVRSVGT